MATILTSFEARTKQMLRTLTIFGLAAGMCVSLPTAAQTTTYTFGTVTAVDLDEKIPRIVGLEKDTGAPLTVAFVDFGDLSYRYAVNRCVPLFLTMMEKPGRYDLQLRLDQTGPGPPFQTQFKGCRLLLKP
jgi:hypothetical protein